MGIFSVNALFPTLFLLGERAVFNVDPRGYLAFAHSLADLGFLPPDTRERVWGIWEEAYKNARPGANFGYEAQAYVIFVIPAIFMAYFMMRSARSKAAKWGYAAVSGTLLAGLVLSLSRTGIFTFLLCCLLYARSKHKFTFAAFAAAVVAILLVAMPDNYFLQRYTMQSHDAYPMAEKVVQIVKAFQSTASNPIYILTGNPGLVDKSQGGFNPHNQFLLDLMTKGVLAFALGIAMFPNFLKRLRERLREDAEAEGGYGDMARIIRISILSMLIQCFSTATLINSNTSIMLWVPVFFLLHMTVDPKPYKLVWR